MVRQQQEETIMAMDMPPAPVHLEYRMEKAPSALDPRSARLVAAVATARAAPVSHMSMPILPELDAASTSMTPQDRVAVKDIRRTFAMNAPSVSAAIPDSYVGARLKLALSEVNMDGASSAAEIRQMRCRTVSMVMDARAGAYVDGGEASAEAARRAIPKSLLAECRAAESGIRTASRSQFEHQAASDRDQRKAPVTTRVSYARGASMAFAETGRSR